jgi:hypothetical protein
MNSRAKIMRLFCFIITILFLGAAIFLMGYDYGYIKALEDLTEMLNTPAQNSKFEVVY